MILPWKPTFRSLSPNVLRKNGEIIKKQAQTSNKDVWAENIDDTGDLLLPDPIGDAGKKRRFQVIIPVVFHIIIKMIKT